MKKRLLSVLLCTILTVGALPVHGYAAADEYGIETEVESEIAEELPKDDFSYSNISGTVNDVLFAEYVDRLFGIENGLDSNRVSLAALRLNSNLREIYDALKSRIKNVADGTETSTRFTMDGRHLPGDSTEFKLLLDVLLSDCSYELYWFDKTQGVGASYSSGTTTYSFTVASAYRGEDPYTTNAAKTSAAKAAAVNARGIVSRYTSYGDLEKLVAYRQEICNLTSYNTAAAGGGTAYGDPWQLIYVFDGDASTTVVCEGYSKAFQYLCEQSTFSSGIDCAITTGVMRSGSSGGGHMWNTVTMDDGKNYLVDVTNCDAGTIGATDRLFLKGMQGGINEGYSITIGSRTVIYTYDSDTLSTFPSARLVLSSVDYTKPENGSAVAETERETEGETEDETETVPCSHVWDSGRVTVPANCTSSGVKTYTCTKSGCGATKTDTIAALDHIYAEDAAVAATCTTAGKTAGRHCSRCGIVLIAQTVVAAKGHTVVKDAAVAATCTAAGKTEGKHCSVCKAVLTAQTAVPAKGHTVVRDAAVAATCTAAGKTEGEHCSVCKTVLTAQTAVSAKGHSYGAAKVVNGSVVNQCSGCGATKTADATMITSISNVAGGVQLSWNARNGAAKYAVYYKAGANGKWKKATTTQSVSCTKKSLKSGTTYYFYVRCLNSKGNAIAGYDSGTSSILYLSTPVVSSAVGFDGGIHVKWKAVAGAPRYRVFRKIIGGGWEKVADVSGTEYNVTGLKSGVTYSFTVACVDANGNQFSAYNNTGKSAMYLAATTLASLEPGRKSMTVRWNRGAGAASYQIQYSTDAGFRKKNKTVTVDGADSVFRTISKLSSGKTYYVRIRCVNKVGKTKCYSAWSGVKNVKVQ